MKCGEKQRKTIKNAFEFLTNQNARRVLSILQISIPANKEKIIGPLYFFLDLVNFYINNYIQQTKKILNLCGKKSNSVVSKMTVAVRNCYTKMTQKNYFIGI